MRLPQTSPSFVVRQATLSLDIGLSSYVVYIGKGESEDGTKVLGCTCQQLAGMLSQHLILPCGGSIFALPDLDLRKLRIIHPE